MGSKKRSKRQNKVNTRPVEKASTQPNPETPPPTEQKQPTIPLLLRARPTATKTAWDKLPLPFFQPDDSSDIDFFRLDHAKTHLCYREDRCWVCGQRVGPHKAFVLNVSEFVERQTSIPPCHRECLLFSLRYYPPFTSDFNHPHSVVVLYITSDYRIFQKETGSPELIFRPSDPLGVTWWWRAAPAPRNQIVQEFERVRESIGSASGRIGPDGRNDFERKLEIAKSLIPRT